MATMTGGLTLTVAGMDLAAVREISARDFGDPGPSFHDVAVTSKSFCLDSALVETRAALAQTGRALD